MAEPPSAPDTGPPGSASPEAGVGCRPVVVLFAVIFAFAAAALGGGLALTLSCTGACARFGLVLYAAGGPVSGLFAVLAGELPIAWPLDLTVWIVVAIALARRFPGRTARTLGIVVGAALVYGAVLSALIERV